MTVFLCAVIIVAVVAIMVGLASTDRKIKQLKDERRKTYHMLR